MNDNFKVEELPESKLIVTNDKGEQIECEVLFTFESDETNKNYIVYTDKTLDEKGNMKAYAAIYNPNEENSPLIPVESEKEWKIIEGIMEWASEQAQKLGENPEAPAPAAPEAPGPEQN